MAHTTTSVNILNVWVVEYCSIVEYFLNLDSIRLYEIKISYTFNNITIYL